MMLAPYSRRYWVLLAAVTALAAALPAGLAVLAWRSGERHRQSAERALRDYAQVAAGQFRQLITGQMYPAVAAIFAPVGSSRLSADRSALPPASALRRSRDASQCAECGLMLSPAWYFRFTPADSTLDVDGPISGDQRRWIAGALSRMQAALEDREREHISAFDTLRSDPSMLILTVRRDTAGAPRAVYGFGLSLASVVDSVVQPLLRRAPLLPLPAMTAPANDSVLSLTLESPDGARSIPLTSRRIETPYSAALHGGLYFGGWRVRLSLDPRTAPPYLVGEIPHSRGWMLVALVLVTFGLIATIFALAWRTWMLGRMREEFVANVSHELRTPLAQILLFSETLSLRRLTSPRGIQEAASVIAAETRRLIELVERVLAFGRATHAPGAPPMLVQQSLTPLIREAIAAFAPLAAQSDVMLQSSLEDNVTAPVDSAGFRQVLLNLLDNAVKFGPLGQTVTIALDLDQGSARLRIDDQGPGIPSRDRRGIWQPFRRLEREIESRVAGSGLGLAVVGEVLRQHGGSASVEDAPGGGARFTVRFPGARRADREELACAS